MDAITTTARARRLVAVGLAAGLTLALVACGDDDDDDASPDADQTTTSEAADDGGDTGGGGGAVTYEVTEISYSDVAAPAGGTIDVENSSGAPHTFTADDGAFDVSYGPDETAPVDVPAEAGEYPFHCEIHSSMTATLTVE